MEATSWADWLGDIIATARVRCLILLQPLIRQHQTTLWARKGGQGGQGILAASRTGTKCQNPATIPKVMVLRSNCWQDVVAVPVSHAESECQAAGNNPFDFWKLGRLFETHQPVTRIVQNGRLLPSFPTTKTTSKATAGSLLGAVWQTRRKCSTDFLHSGFQSLVITGGWVNFKWLDCGFSIISFHCCHSFCETFNLNFLMLFVQHSTLNSLPIPHWPFFFFFFYCRCLQKSAGQVNENDLKQ